MPVLEWGRNYKKAYFKDDLFAGLTVGTMLIPQGMAYAMIAGLPPIYGLYASLVPQVVYAVFGTSRQLSVAPVAMDSLLVAAGLTALKLSGQTYIEAALLVALLMGLFQVLAGFLKLGFLVNFLSKPVISGFTTGAALIIGLNQLKHLLGTDIQKSNQIHILLKNTFVALPEIHWLTFIIGIAGVFLLLLIKKKRLKIPGALTVVVIGTLVVYLFKLNELGVQIVGDIPKGLPKFSIPNLQVSYLEDLIPLAVTIGIIAYMEAISVAKAIEAKHGDYKINPNQEMIAMGMANVIGSFFKSYPVTGGFSRSAVNDQAGAKTQLSSVIAAILMGFTLLFLTPLFYYLPKTVLAAIIMVAVFGLIDFKIIRKLWYIDKKELTLLLLTFGVTAFVGIKEGIITGMLASVGIVVYKISTPHIAVLGRLKGTNIYRNIERFSDVEKYDDRIIIRFDAPLFYANVNYLTDFIEQTIERNPQIKYVVLNGESVNHIDYTSVQALCRLYKKLSDKGIHLIFTEFIGPVRDEFRKTGLLQSVGEHHFFTGIDEALKYIDSEDKTTFSKVPFQTSVKS